MDGLRLNTLCRWPALLLAGLVLLALAGCSRPAHPDTLVFGIATAPASLNPILATDASAERIDALLYAPLVDLDQQGRPRPGQVRWTEVDARHYRLRLVAHPARFDDGRLPTLSDVRATLEAAAHNPASPHATALADLQRISRAPRGGLLLTLARPDPRFPEKLHIGLIPADVPLQRLDSHPDGTGSFRFIARDAQDNLLLERRRDGLKVRFETIPDPTMRALKLLHGELNLVQNDLPYELYPRLLQDPAIHLHTHSGTTFSYLGFNLDDRYLSERRIREAIAYGIDRKAIVRYLFHGHADLTSTLLSPNQWAADPNLVPYRYDPKKARALLRAAGFGLRHPLHLSYKTSTDPFRLRIAAALQAQLARIGIRLTIQSYEWGTFFGDIKAGRFQLYSLSWVGIRSPDIFRYAFDSASMPPQGANRGHYRSADVDRWIGQAAQLPEAQARPIYWKIQQRLQHDLVYVPLWHEQNLLLARGVRHARPLANGAYTFLNRVSLAHD